MYRKHLRTVCVCVQVCIMCVHAYPHACVCQLSPSNTSMRQDHATRLVPRPPEKQCGLGKLVN